MNIDFDPKRWSSVKDAHRQWWAGSLGRPLVNLKVKGRDPGRKEPSIPSYEFTSFYDLSITADSIADRMIYDLESCRYIGDAFPCAIPNFGPGVMAAFMGLELRNGDDTVWFHQEKQCELADIRLAFDPENVWYRRVCDIYKALAERSEGLVHLGMTDLGGNLDIVASFRQSENLLLDLYDVPDTVKSMASKAHEMWWKYFDELNKIIQPAHPGYAAWTPFYSEKPYYMLQCDFGFMIGKEMFDEFALPELKETCRKLTNPFFHLDGPGLLTHLDSLLAIPELKGIQWVPGAGQPDITEWPDVYRKIRDAGKQIQFFTSQSAFGWRALEKIAAQLGSADGIMMYGEVPAEDEQEARRSFGC